MARGAHGGLLGARQCGKKVYFVGPGGSARMVSILIGKFVTLSAVVLIEALFVRETASDCDAAS